MVPDTRGSAYFFDNVIFNMYFHGNIKTNIRTLLNTVKIIYILHKTSLKNRIQYMFCSHYLKIV